MQLPDPVIMSGDEIKVPKELREFMPDGAKETILGEKNGAIRQYRYGNLHIREYADEFLVHRDKVDPRKDPVGHLIHDAPEVLVGLACGIFGGSRLAKKLLDKNSIKPALAFGLISSIISGYAGYLAARKIKNHLE